MIDSEVPHSQNLKIIRDEAARVTLDMLQTRASAQRLVLFSIAVLGQGCSTRISQVNRSFDASTARLWYTYQ
ncbi:MAG: hypothetical protein O3B74_05715, partial [Proteobacteria bacterium]|nr:hypothetical protein [Pseudomonadota bacterium]